MPQVRLLFIEADGALHLGFGKSFPLATWFPADNQWKIIPAVEQPAGWGSRVTKAEAERCYAGSTSAKMPEGLLEDRDISVEDLIRLQPEIYDDYDGRITRHSPEEDRAYFDRLRPAALKGRDAP